MSKIDWDSVQYGEEGIVIIKRDEETKTLRDEFAMAAITGVMDDHVIPAVIAKKAYEIADAMLKARNGNG